MLASESIIEHGVAATRGHLASNGGIRGHSAGPLFPCVVYASGTFVDGLQYNFISPDGVHHTGYETWEQAAGAAREWLDSREVQHEQTDSVGA